MRVLIDLYAKAEDTTLPTEERLEAQYRYASFLEEHSTQVFFNDMIWKGYQTSTFLGGDGVESQGLTRFIFWTGRRRLRSPASPCV